MYSHQWKFQIYCTYDSRGHSGRELDRMVLGFTTTYSITLITTNVVSSSPVHGEVYSIHHYMIKFVSDLRQVGGFLRVLWFPPPIKLTPRYNWNKHQNVTETPYDIMLKGKNLVANYNIQSFPWYTMFRICCPNGPF